MKIFEVTAPKFKVLDSDTVELQGKTFTFPRSVSRGDKLVLIAADLLEAMWQRDGESFYVTPGPEYKNQIGKRIEQFKQYFEKNNEIAVGEFHVHPTGRGGFSNGRHRTRVLLELGFDYIPLALNAESINNLFNLEN